MKNTPCEHCAICGCALTRKQNTYAADTVDGRSHASRHHYVAERFFGRTANRNGRDRTKIFDECPWGHERQTVLFCYECHEELLHNPVLLPEDLELFASLVRARGLSEREKPVSKKMIAERIRLFHEVIVAGLRALTTDSDV